MKRIFLYAYDKINLGDDLFISFITNRYPDINFYLWTDKRNKKTFQNLKNLKVIDKNSVIVRLLKKIRASFEVRYKMWWEKRCNASVYIGGSIFMEYKTWKNQITWLNYQAEHYHFFVLGANFGPYKTEDYRRQLGIAFNKMEDVCFRDMYSLKKFKENPKVRYAPDILFSYLMPVMPVKKNQIFISVISCSGRDEEYNLNEAENIYIKNMSKILKEYLKAGYNLVFSSFCREEGDERGIRKIIDRLHCQGSAKIQILNYNGTNLMQVLYTLAESEYIIGSRFHAVVLAMAAGRPVLPVIYSDKTKNMLDDLGFTGVVFDLRRNEAWNYEQSRKNLDSSPFILPEGIRKDSQEHFKKLDEFLKYREKRK